MPAPICVNCEIEYLIVKAGGYAVEMFSDPPRPYKIWYADFWGCPGCGNRIVSGYGDGPILEHYQEGFQAFLDQVLETDYCVKAFEKVEDECIE